MENYSLDENYHACVIKFLFTNFLETLNPNSSFINACIYIFISMIIVIVLIRELNDVSNISFYLEIKIDRRLWNQSSTTRQGFVIRGARSIPLES